MEQEIQPFDFTRMFIGDAPPLFIAEVVFRTVFMYLFALLAARFLGKRGMGQLTPFEYLVVIALGSATGDPMFYHDVPLLYGVIAITCIVLIQRCLYSIAQRSKKVENYLESSPDLVIKDGVLLVDELAAAGISKDELMMELRLQSIKNLGEIEYAYLEPEGKISVLRMNKEKMKKGETTLPSNK